MTNYLDNDWKATGNDLPSLKQTLNELDKRTTCLSANLNDIVIYHVPKESRYKDPFTGQINVKYINSLEDIIKEEVIKVNFFVPDKNKIFAYTESGLNVIKSGALKATELLKSPHKEEIIKNILQEGTMVGIRNKLFTLSNSVDSTLSQRILMDGHGITKHTLGRDLHIAELFIEGADTKIVYREQFNVRKAFAMLGPKYKYIPQSVLIDIIDNLDPEGKLGKPECFGWEVNQNYTKVILEFPEKAEELCSTYGIKDSLIPGVMIMKSDVGLSALRIVGTWRYKNSISVCDEVSHKHSGDFEIEDFLNEVKVNIFDKYKELPETLCKLMMTDITKPEWNKLSKKDFRKVNGDAVKAVLKNAFKELKITKAIQKKNEKLLFEELYNEVDEDMKYTAYDICLMLMDMPSRIEGLNKNYKDALQKAVGKAPYIRYEEITKKQAILLTA